MRTLAVLLTLVLSPALAQAAPDVYIRSNGQFVGHGSEYSRGFWVPVVRDAGDVFQSNFAALEEYNLHVSTGRWAGILSWGGIAAYVLYSSITLANDSYNGWAAVGILVIPVFGGSYLAVKSNQHLLRAMNLMNGIAPAQARLTPTIRLPLLAWSF